MTGAELKAARKALGLSQRGLAERFGVAQMTIWRWEQAERIEHGPILALALERLGELAAR